MSARPAMQRQTKQRKQEKCLPGQRCRGRQKQENPKNVCPTSDAEADKTRKTRKMSAGATKQRQTKTGKAGKCLPDQQCRGRQKQEKQENVCPTSNAEADKTRKTRKISARPAKQRQTKTGKSPECLLDQ